MTLAPFWKDSISALYVGDAREVLSGMRGGSADCIVTSPPYWGKRDYGVAGQYGSEPDPAAYVETLRATFAEARRVLADDGTCWLNLGDSYSAGGGTANGLHAYLGPHLTAHRVAGMWTKNLLGMPWRVAFALEEDGWILRNAIVWHKPNAMPESVRDRLNCRHELIFLFVKQPSYWFDLDPIRIPHAPATQAQLRAAPKQGHRRPACGPMGGTRPPKYGAHARAVVAGRRYGNLQHIRGHRAGHPRGRNPGDVWAIPRVLTAVRTSPRSPSICRSAVSPPDASRVAPYSTCSPGPARQVWPLSNLVGGLPESSCRRSSRAWPLTGSAMLISPRTASREQAK